MALSISANLEAPLQKLHQMGVELKRLTTEVNQFNAAQTLVGWRVRRNRLTAVLNLTGLTLLVLTAYMLESTL